MFGPVGEQSARMSSVWKHTAAINGKTGLGMWAGSADGRDNKLVEGDPI
jgi:hypothetical protein